MYHCRIWVRSKQKVDKGHKDFQRKLAFNTTGNEENQKVQLNIILH